MKAIGRLVAINQAHRRKAPSSNIPGICLAAFLLMSLGCNYAEDRLQSLVLSFPQIRQELNEVRDLVLSLAQTDNVAGILAGNRYNETPDQIVFLGEKVSPYTDVVAKQDGKSRAQLERLQHLSRNVRLFSARLGEDKETVWVTMHYGKDHDWGYLFTRNPRQSLQKDGRLVPIPGEKDWYTFRR